MSDTYSRRRDDTRSEHRKDDKREHRDRERDRDEQRTQRSRTVDEEDQDYPRRRSDHHRDRDAVGDGRDDRSESRKSTKSRAAVTGDQYPDSKQTTDRGLIDPVLQGPHAQNTPVPDLSSNVPNQFPDQTPLNYALPYRPPITSTDSFGAAADFYGDQGESVHRQPGMRPHTPIVTGTEPHLMAPLVVAAPPIETGHGAAAEFYGGESQGAQTTTLTESTTTTNFADNTSYSAQQYYGSSASRPPGPAGQQHAPVTQSQPLSPGKQPSQPVSSMPLIAAAGAVAGAAGLAASAWNHEQHQQQENYTSGNVQQSHSQNSAYGTSSGVGSSTGYGRPPRERRRDRGPLGRLAEWWNNHEDVMKMEEYTEYIGVCKYCFDPHSSPVNAPRRHHHHDRRPSPESRRQNRVSKSNRYSSSSSSSESESRRTRSKRNVSTVAAVAAAGAIGAGLVEAHQRRDEKIEEVKIQATEFERRDDSRRGEPISAEVSGQRRSSDRRRTDDITSEINVTDTFEETTARQTERPRVEDHTPPYRRGIDNSYGGRRIEEDLISEAVTAGLAEASTQDHDHGDLHDDRHRSRTGHHNYKADTPESSRRAQRRSETYVEEYGEKDKQTGFFESFFSPSSKRRKTTELHEISGSGSERSRRARNQNRGQLGAGEALLGLGAAAAVLAASASHRDSRMSDVFAVKERRPNPNSAYTPRATRQIRQQSRRHAEEGWESVSESSSADSALAFGDEEVFFEQSTRRDSYDSYSSSSDGKRKQNRHSSGRRDERQQEYRAEEPIRRRTMSKSNEIPNPLPNSQSAAQVSATRINNRESSHPPSRPAPMQYIDPMPIESSPLPAFPIDNTPIRIQTNDVPLQQPQPMSPTRTASYERQAEFASVVGRISNVSGKFTAPVRPGIIHAETMPADLPSVSPHYSTMPYERDGSINESFRPPAVREQSDSVLTNAAVIGGMAAVAASAFTSSEKRQRWSSGPTVRFVSPTPGNELGTQRPANSSSISRVEQDAVYREVLPRPHNGLPGIENKSPRTAERSIPEYRGAQPPIEPSQDDAPITQQPQQPQNVIYREITPPGYRAPSIEEHKETNVTHQQVQPDYYVVTPDFSTRSTDAAGADQPQSYSHVEIIPQNSAPRVMSLHDLPDDFDDASVAGDYEVESTSHDTAPKVKSLDDLPADFDDISVDDVFDDWKDRYSDAKRTATPVSVFAPAILSEDVDVLDHRADAVLDLVEVSAIPSEHLDHAPSAFGGQPRPIPKFRLLTATPPPSELSTPKTQGPSNLREMSNVDDTNDKAKPKQDNNNEQKPHVRWGRQASPTRSTETSDNVASRDKQTVDPAELAEVIRNDEAEDRARKVSETTANLTAGPTILASDAVDLSEANVDLADENPPLRFHGQPLFDTVSDSDLPLGLGDRLEYLSQPSGGGFVEGEVETDEDNLSVNEARISQGERSTQLEQSTGGEQVNRIGGGTAVGASLHNRSELLASASTEDSLYTEDISTPVSQIESPFKLQDSQMIGEPSLFTSVATSIAASAAMIASVVPAVGGTRTTSDQETEIAQQSLPGSFIVDLETPGVRYDDSHDTVPVNEPERESQNPALRELEHEGVDRGLTPSEDSTQGLPVTLHDPLLYEPVDHDQKQPLSALTSVASDSNTVTDSAQEKAPSAAISNPAVKEPTLSSELKSKTKSKWGAFRDAFLTKARASTDGVKEAVHNVTLDDQQTTRPAKAMEMESNTSQLEQDKTGLRARALDPVTSADRDVIAVRESDIGFSPPTIERNSTETAQRSPTSSEPEESDTPLSRQPSKLTIDIPGIPDNDEVGSRFEDFAEVAAKTPEPASARTSTRPVSWHAWSSDVGPLTFRSRQRSLDLALPYRRNAHYDDHFEVIPEMIYLPPSRPGSPYDSVEDIEFTPFSPSITWSPRDQIHARQPSATAIPLRFRRPPASPGVTRDSPFSSPSSATEAISPTSPSRSRVARPKSIEFRSNEFRPLYLVEFNTKIDEPEEQLPSLPSSRTTSRASSLHDSTEEAYESAVQSPLAYGTPDISMSPQPLVGSTNVHEFDLDDQQRERLDEEGFLDSQQATPKASSFEPDVMDYFGSVPMASMDSGTSDGAHHINRNQISGDTIHHAETEHESTNASVDRLQPDRNQGQDISETQRHDDLPPQAQAYLEALEAVTTANEGGLPPQAHAYLEALAAVKTAVEANKPEVSHDSNVVDEVARQAHDVEEDLYSLGSESLEANALEATPRLKLDDNANDDRPIEEPSLDDWQAESFSFSTAKSKKKGKKAKAASIAAAAVALTTAAALALPASEPPTPAEDPSKDQAFGIVDQQVAVAEEEWATQPKTKKKTGKKGKGRQSKMDWTSDTPTSVFDDRQHTIDDLFDPEISHTERETDDNFKTEVRDELQDEEITSKPAPPPVVEDEDFASSMVRKGKKGKKNKNRQLTLEESIATTTPIDTSAENANGPEAIEPKPERGAALDLAHVSMPSTTDAPVEQSTIEEDLWGNTETRKGKKGKKGKKRQSLPEARLTSFNNGNIDTTLDSGEPAPTEEASEEPDLGSVKLRRSPSPPVDPLSVIVPEKDDDNDDWNNTSKRKGKKGKKGKGRQNTDVAFSPGPSSPAVPDLPGRFLEDDDIVQELEAEAIRDDEQNLSQDQDHNTETRDENMTARSESSFQLDKPIPESTVDDEWAETPKVKGKKGKKKKSRQPMSWDVLDEKEADPGRAVPDQTPTNASGRASGFAEMDKPTGDDAQYISVSESPPLLAENFKKSSSDFPVPAGSGSQTLEHYTEANTGGDLLPALNDPNTDETHNEEPRSQPYETVETRVAEESVWAEPPAKSRDDDNEENAAPTPASGFGDLEAPDATPVTSSPELRSIPNQAPDQLNDNISGTRPASLDDQYFAKWQGIAEALEANTDATAMESSAIIEHIAEPATIPLLPQRPEEAKHMNNVAMTDMADVSESVQHRTSNPDPKQSRDNRHLGSIEDNIGMPSILAIPEHEMDADAHSKNEPTEDFAPLTFSPDEMVTAWSQREGYFTPGFVRTENPLEGTTNDNDSHDPRPRGPSSVPSTGTIIRELGEHDITAEVDADQSPERSTLAHEHEEMDALRASLVSDTVEERSRDVENEEENEMRELTSRLEKAEEGQSTEDFPFEQPDLVLELQHNQQSNVPDAEERTVPAVGDLGPDEREREVMSKLEEAEEGRFEASIPTTDFQSENITSERTETLGMSPGDPRPEENLGGNSKHVDEFEDDGDMDLNTSVKSKKNKKKDKKKNQSTTSIDELAHDRHSEAKARLAASFHLPQNEEAILEPEAPTPSTSKKQKKKKKRDDFQAYEEETPQPAFIDPFSDLPAEEGEATEIIPYNEASSMPTPSMPETEEPVNEFEMPSRAKSKKKKNKGRSMANDEGQPSELPVDQTARTDGSLDLESQSHRVDAQMPRDTAADTILDPQAQAQVVEPTLDESSRAVEPNEDEEWEASTKSKKDKKKKKGRAQTKADIVPSATFVDPFADYVDEVAALSNAEPVATSSMPGSINPEIDFPEPEDENPYTAKTKKKSKKNKSKADQVPPITPIATFVDPFADSAEDDIGISRTTYTEQESGSKDKTSDQAMIHTNPLELGRQQDVEVVGVPVEIEDELMYSVPVAKGKKGKKGKKAKTFVPFESLDIEPEKVGNDLDAGTKLSYHAELDSAQNEDVHEMEEKSRSDAREAGALDERQESSTPHHAAETDSEAAPLAAFRSTREDDETTPALETTKSEALPLAPGAFFEESTAAEPELEPRLASSPQEEIMDNSEAYNLGQLQNQDENPGTPKHMIHSERQPDIDLDYFTRPISTHEIDTAPNDETEPLISPARRPSNSSHYDESEHLYGGRTRDLQDDYFGAVPVDEANEVFQERADAVEAMETRQSSPDAEQIWKQAMSARKKLKKSKKKGNKQQDSVEIEASPREQVEQKQSQTWPADDTVPEAPGGWSAATQSPAETHVRDDNDAFDAATTEAMKRIPSGQALSRREIELDYDPEFVMRDTEAMKRAPSGQALSRRDIEREIELDYDPEFVIHDAEAMKRIPSGQALSRRDIELASGVALSCRESELDNDGEFVMRDTEAMKRAPSGQALSRRDIELGSGVAPLRREIELDSDVEFVMHGTETMKRVPSGQALSRRDIELASSVAPEHEDSEALKRVPSGQALSRRDIELASSLTPELEYTEALKHVLSGQAISRQDTEFAAAISAGLEDSGFDRSILGSETVGKGSPARTGSPLEHIEDDFQAVPKRVSRRRRSGRDSPSSQASTEEHYRSNPIPVTEERQTHDRVETIHPSEQGREGSSDTDPTFEQAVARGLNESGFDAASALPGSRRGSLAHSTMDFVLGLTKQTQDRARLWAFGDLTKEVSSRTPSQTGPSGEWHSAQEGFPVKPSEIDQRQTSVVNTEATSSILPSTHGSGWSFESIGDVGKPTTQAHAEPSIRMATHQNRDLAFDAHEGLKDASKELVTMVKTTPGTEPDPVKISQLEARFDRLEETIVDIDKATRDRTIERPESNTPPLAKQRSMSSNTSELANTRRPYMRSPPSGVATDKNRSATPFNAQSPAASSVSNRSLTPTLRRRDRTIFGSVSPPMSKQPGASGRQNEAGSATLQPYDPLKGRGKDRRQEMARDDNESTVFEGSDVRSSPRSPGPAPTPPTAGARQYHGRDSTSSVCENENRSSGQYDSRSSGQYASTYASGGSGTDDHRFIESLRARDVALQQKDEQINGLRSGLDMLQREVTKLTEHNQQLLLANQNLSNDTNGRYATLQAEHTHAHRQWQETSRQLEELRDRHGEMSTNMEDVVEREISAALTAKDADIRQLRMELDRATEQIRFLQRELVASSQDESFLSVRDEDYFESACQQLCQHVQQWVLRFSKYSDHRACRPSSELHNEQIETRLDSAVLDETDVDTYLADRVKRRDVLMSVVMTMIWEFVFTRYLFGMDREQRQRLKAIEKSLLEVGPQRAVAQWRSITLTLLSRTERFAAQRVQDTEAVVHEIYNTLATMLPPPSNVISQITDSLRNVMKLAVDLSIEMRIQRPEYVMLPPLHAEYDSNGNLSRKVHFNASLMNERSGEFASNEELENKNSVVRLVLFPLVVKRGNDQGETDEEVVICPAQVLVAQSAKEKKSVRIVSGPLLGEDMGGARSVQSLMSPDDG